MPSGIDVSLGRLRAARLFDLYTEQQRRCMAHQTLTSPLFPFFFTDGQVDKCGRVLFTGVAAGGSTASPRSVVFDSFTTTGTGYAAPFVGLTPEGVAQWAVAMDGPGVRTCACTCTRGGGGGRYLAVDGAGVMMATMHIDRPLHSAPRPRTGPLLPASPMPSSTMARRAALSTPASPIIKCS